MNFLHIHTTDKKDGAAITAYRFHKALLEKGFGSHILCGRKYAFGQDTSQVVPGGMLGGLANAAAGKFLNDLGLQGFGFPSSWFIRHSKWLNQWADVVILRNPHGWYLSLGILPWVAQKAPIIWRLPDMWSFTGHCAYSYNCEKWKSGCGNCPDLKEYPGLIFDTTHFLWKKKKKIYNELKGRLILVTPSKWLKGLVQASPLLSDFRCELIPPGLDLGIFRPQPKERLRSVLGIEKNEKVIMFSSFKFKHQRKGADILIGIIKELSKNKEFPLTLLLAGKGAESLDFEVPIKIVRAGFIEDDARLAELYNIADVYLSLSRADNLPNSLIEASACGLPIVTLDSGGCGEAIEEAKSGYALKDSEGIVEALAGILSDGAKKEEFSRNARRFAELNFAMDKQVNSYVALAKELTGKR